MTDDDPNDAYEVVPIESGQHGPPRGWWTVKRKRHCGETLSRQAKGRSALFRLSTGRGNGRSNWTTALSQARPATGKPGSSLLTRKLTLPKKLDVGEEYRNRNGAFLSGLWSRGH
jgi:hypothetical protein